jgi:hypothetical protein
MLEGREQWTDDAGPPWCLLQPQRSDSAGGYIPFLLGIVAMIGVFTSLNTLYFHKRGIRSKIQRLSESHAFNKMNSVILAEECEKYKSSQLSPSEVISCLALDHY